MLVVSAKMVQSICMALKIVFLIFFLSENPKVFHTHSVVVHMVKNVQFLKGSRKQHTKFQILFKNLPKEM